MADDDPTADALEIELPALPSADSAPRDSVPKDAASAAPRTKRTRAPRAPRTPAPRRVAKIDIAGGMSNLYGMAAMGISMIPSAVADQATGLTRTQQIAGVIMEQADQCGKAWESLAKENPQVRQMLERMLTVSTIGALIAAHTPIIAAGAIAYGLVPPGLGAIIGVAAQASANPSSTPE